MRSSAISCALLTALLLCAPSAFARAMRHHFEPSDLELSDVGVLETDLQTGLLRGQDSYRAAIVDFELDLGVMRNLEMSVEGCANGHFESLEHRHNRSLSYDHVWTSLTAGLFTLRLGNGVRPFSVGLQMGPRIPVMRIARGVGLETLWTMVSGFGINIVALNFGLFIDPRIIEQGRSRGYEASLGFHSPIRKGSPWLLALEGSIIRFTSSDPNELHLFPSVTRSFSDALDASITGVWGPHSGGDRYGLLAGITARSSLW